MSRGVEIQSLVSPLVRKYAAMSLHRAMAFQYHEHKGFEITRKDESGKPVDTASCRAVTIVAKILETIVDWHS